MAISVEGWAPEPTARRQSRPTDMQGGWLFELEQAMLSQGNKKPVASERWTSPEAARADDGARLPMARDDARDGATDPGGKASAMASVTAATAPSRATSEVAREYADVERGDVVPARTAAADFGGGVRAYAAIRIAPGETENPVDPTQGSAMTALSTAQPPSVAEIVDGPSGIEAPTEADFAPATTVSASASAAAPAQPVLSGAVVAPAHSGFNAEAMASEPMWRAAAIEMAAMAGTTGMAYPPATVAGLAPAGVGQAGAEAVPQTVAVKVLTAGVSMPTAHAAGKGAPPDTAEAGQHDAPSAEGNDLQNAEREQYARRLLHVYRDADGVRAWIRDVDVGAAQAQLLAQTMASELAIAGAPLSALTLNGRRLALPASSAPRPDANDGYDAEDFSADQATPLATPNINANGAV